MSSLAPRHTRAASRGAAVVVLAIAAALLAGSAAAQQAPPTAARPAAKAPTQRKGAARATAPRLTPRQRVAGELRSAASQVRAAMVVQDTTTLAGLWSEDYMFTSLSGETYSKSERLEAVMSPAFEVDEAAEVLPSELDIVRVYGNVAVMHSRLAPVRTTRSGARGGRARLLTVWVRERGKWRTVAAQATAVSGPLPPMPGKRS